MQNRRRAFFHMAKLKVLLTGGAGRIGRHLTPPFEERYKLRSFDMRPVPGANDVVNAALGDLGALRHAMAGIDVVVHLAATSDEAPMDALVPNNICGLHNTFEAAREAGVRRFVFASSCQTVTGYPRDYMIEITDPVRPQTIYGATKVFGEALGRYYHDRHGMEFVAIRIGAFQPCDSRHLAKQAIRDLWLSPRDAIELFARAIEKPGVGFALVFGKSRAGRERLSLRSARELLDFEPQDDDSSITTPLTSPTA